MQLLAAEPDQPGIGRKPELVAFVAEILQAQPYGIAVRHQERAPVVEDLQTAHLYVRLLYVDPVVADQLLALTAALVEFQPRNQQADDDEIAIDQSARNLADVGGGQRLHAPDQLLYRH